MDEEMKNWRNGSLSREASIWCLLMAKTKKKEEEEEEEEEEEGSALRERHSANVPWKHRDFLNSNDRNALVIWKLLFFFFFFFLNLFILFLSVKYIKAL